MEKKELKIHKIPLNEMIETLVSLYNHGVDYVDIVCIPGKEYDKMAISFVAEYMTEQGKENFANMESEMELDTNSNKLTDDDINQLI
jgi:hypothetical protein